MESTSSKSKEVSEEEKKTVDEDSFEKNPTILNKYKTAARIAQDALIQAKKYCAAGFDIARICAEGDQKIEEEMAKVYTSKKSGVADKGIAFPTCVSVNEVCGHFSPFKDESKLLVDGDLVKIDLGCHVDGYLVQVAETIVIGATRDRKMTGRKADVIVATRKVFEAALRLVKEGNVNTQVTKMIAQISSTYKTNPLEGVASHRIKKNEIDGDEMIRNKDIPEKKPEEKKFSKYEVYVLDIILSTGEGKTKEVRICVKLD